MSCKDENGNKPDHLRLEPNIEDNKCVTQDSGAKILHKIDTELQTAETDTIEEIKVENPENQGTLQNMLIVNVKSEGLNCKADVPEIVGVKSEMDHIELEHEELDIKYDEDVMTESHKMVLDGTPPELEQFSCKFEECKFETKYKKSLQTHMKIHKGPSMFDCRECSYKYVLKSDLQHKKQSQIQMYRCDQCSFETKEKRGVKSHMLIHRDPSQLEMFKCSECSYECKRKCHLQSHMLVHKDPSLVEKFKCHECGFEFKRKSNLEQHMLVHKDQSEVEMYRCDQCSFETKRKEWIKSHMLVHTDPSRLKMFKCSQCSFECKRRFNLGQHMVVHQDPVSIKMYECNECNYVSKRRSDIQKHQLIHKDPSEIKMHKCKKCNYKSKRSINLKRHMLIHTDPALIKMFKCD